MADNYFRLMCLVLNVCPEPLREFFMKLAKSDATRPYTELSAYLSSRMPEIMQLKTTGALSERQFNSIFQRGENSDTCQWDILLLVTLIKAFFSGQLLPEVQVAMDELRLICGELQQIPYGSEIIETEFESYCRRIITALKTLAKQVHGKEYETEIRDKIREALCAPGRSFTGTIKNVEERITSIEEYFKQWNENQTIILQSLQKRIDDLKTNTKTVAADSKASSSLLRSVTVTKNRPTGKKMKRLKTVDNILYRLFKQFRLTMQTELSDHFIPPTEISEIRTKLNDTHHVIVTGGNNNRYLETALFAIKDLQYNLERCVELYDASDWRHIDSDDVDLVLIRDPFGHTFYDDRKAKSMLDIFDSIFYSLKSVDIIMVTDAEWLSKVKELYEHVLLEEVVQLFGVTSESHPIDLTSVTHEWDSPQRVQPNFTRQITEIFLDRLSNESRQIDQATIHEAKDIMKKNKMLLIAGPPESDKTVLAVALASSYAREEVLLLCSPDGIGTLDLHRTSLVIIDDFVGNYMFDRKKVSEWYSVFDQLHIAVTAGKLNVILICESGKLQQCIDEVGKHPMMSNQLVLTKRPVSIKQESRNDLDPDRPMTQSTPFPTLQEGRDGEAEEALDKHAEFYDAERTVDSLKGTFWHIEL